MIEDDLELAELLKMHLAKADIDVTIALTPLDGMQQFQRERFDLLVLDLSLPQMDGLEICGLRITSYNVCYTNLLRGHCLVSKV